MDDEVVDLSSMEVDPEAISSIHELPARGLAAMERAARIFHIVNALPRTGEELTNSFGPRRTLHVDSSNWEPEHIQHQIEVLNRTPGEGPTRVIFSNLGALRESHCWPIQELMRNRGINSLWFVDDGSDIPLNIDHKVLMEAEMIDSATLLDAVAFGWGSKDAYSGEYGSDKDVIPSDAPLFNKSAT
jgi:hypothetical protein